MIKDLPPEPLEFSFEDQEQDSNDDDTKTYSLNVGKSTSEPVVEVVEEELTLGAVIESEPVVSSHFELRLEDDDADLIISDSPTQTAPTLTEQMLATPIAEQLSEHLVEKISTETTEQTKSIFDEIAEKVREAEESGALDHSAPESQQTSVQVFGSGPTTSADSEATSNVPPTLSIKKSKKLSSKKLTNILLGVSCVFLIAIVVAVNLLLFVDVSSSKDIEKLTQAISQTTAASEKPHKSKDEGELSASMIQMAPLKHDLISGEYKFIFDRQKLTGSFQLDATTPPPPALTAEEVGRHVAPAAWLKKVETQKISFKELNENGKLELSVPTRYYIENGSASSRFVGPTKVTISRTDSSFKIEYRFEIPASAKVSFADELLNGAVTFSF